MTSLEAPALLAPNPVGRARPFYVATLLITVALTGSPFATAEEPGGAQLAWKYHCMTCHGPNGVANSDRYPNLEALAACNHDTLDGANLTQQKGCIACHGMDGKGIASIYPNLDGQWQRYLRLQLQSGKLLLQIW